MPYIKVNLNGRKYVISGLTGSTSSKHILSSLARVDSSFNLEATDQSDSSLGGVEWNERKRSSRSRTRHTRVRYSSTSSLEITEWNNCLRGSVSEKRSSKQACEKDNTRSQEWHVGMRRSNSEKCSRKLLFTDSVRGKKEFPLRILETSSEEHAGKRDGNGREKLEVKKRKRKTKKRPVSEDVTSLKHNESKEMEGKIEIGQKGWKSADDVRGKKGSHLLSSEKKDEKVETNRKTKQSRKSRHSHDKQSQNNDRYIFVDAIDKPSEYRRVHRHVREELNNLRIHKIVSKEVDQRLVDFHVACLQSQRLQPEIHLQNEQETKGKLIQLINSQSKCLSALDKAEKQNKRALNRYKKYLRLDKEKIQFYNANFDSEKIKNMKERESRTSDTDHDTGISEQHSDSSTENKHTTTFYDVYKHDVTIDYVVSDDVIRRENMTEVKESKEHNVIVDCGIIDDVRKSNDAVEIKTDEVNKNGVIGGCVTRNDVKGSGIATYDAISDVIKTCGNTSRNETDEYESKKDETVSDDVINDVNIIDFADDHEINQDVIIIAKQTEIIPFDQSEISSTAIPCWSAGSITGSTVSEMSDCCSHGNSMDQNPRDIKELEEVLTKERKRKLELKQKLDRLCGEMRLVDLRIHEQNKMADVLASLKSLNEGVLKDEREPDDKNFQNEKKNFKKSIRLSRNLYQYQKGEMKENALSLQIIESQIKRKRWHVESAVRDLGQFVTSSLRAQLERILSLEEIAGIKTSVVFKPQLSGTLV